MRSIRKCESIFKSVLHVEFFLHDSSVSMWLKVVSFPCGLNTRTPQLGGDLGDIFHQKKKRNMRLFILFRLVFQFSFPPYDVALNGSTCVDAEGTLFYWSKVFFKGYGRLLDP